jgi:tetratricopeptide (TPR) repeat protein
MYTKYYELKGRKDAKGQPDPAAQKEAYAIGQEYLAKYTSCNDTYSKAVQKFVTQYGEAVKKVGNATELNEALYVKKDYAKAFQVGNQMLAADPENLSLLIQLGYAGYNAQSLNPPLTTFSPTSLGYAKKAVAMLEAGKTPSEWVLFKTKDEALGYLSFAIGEYMINSDPAGALPYYLKAASLAPTKDIALTYGRLGWAYQAGQYKPMQEAFTAKYKEETDESKYALNNLNQVMDRVMDAYARAIRLAGNDPKFAQAKTEWMQQLTDFYKFRNNNTTTGLDAFIASTATKPLPEPFTPQPYVAPATPAPSTGGTASDSGNGAMTTTAPASTAAPAATTQPATTTQNTTAAKPKPATKKP